jgi:hypothetical protein
MLDNYRLSDIPAKRDHFQCRLRRFFAFMTVNAANSFQRLFQIVDRKNPEYDRHRQAEVQAENAIGYRTAYIFKVGRSAPDYTTQCNKRFGSPGFGVPCFIPVLPDGEREFDCAGNQQVSADACLCVGKAFFAA